MPRHFQRSSSSVFLLLVLLLYIVRFGASRFQAVMSYSAFPPGTPSGPNHERHTSSTSAMQRRPSQLAINAATTIREEGTLGTAEYGASSLNSPGYSSSYGHNSAMNSPSTSATSGMNSPGAYPNYASRSFLSEEQAPSPQDEDRPPFQLYRDEEPRKASVRDTTISGMSGVSGVTNKTGSSQAPMMMMAPNTKSAFDTDDQDERKHKIVMCGMKRSMVWLVGGLVVFIVAVGIAVGVGVGIGTASRAASP